MFDRFFEPEYCIFKWKITKDYLKMRTSDFWVKKPVIFSEILAFMCRNIHEISITLKNSVFRSEFSLFSTYLDFVIICQILTHFWLWKIEYAIWFLLKHWRYLSTKGNKPAEIWKLQFFGKATGHLEITDQSSKNPFFTW